MRPSIYFGLFSRRAPVLMLLVFMAALTCAQITPLSDSYTNTATPATNFGAKPLLDVQSASQTTYIHFDLSSIPSGYTSSNIAKASLKLYVNAVTTAGSFNVDYVNGTWAENTITANLSPALGTTIVASVPLVKAQAHDYILIDITPAVGAWLDGTQANDGIALVGNSPINASFDSKESTTQSHPPELDIVFTGGGGSGGGITGVLTGAGSGLTGGGTSGTLNLSLLTSCASGQVLEWNGSAWACANIGGGGGTVTSVGLTAASTDFIVTGSPVTTSGTLGLGWLVLPDSNSTANAIVKRDSLGNFSGGTINALTGFNLGYQPFAFGSVANGNAFLGFAGNSTMTGFYNTGIGENALVYNAAGIRNTAVGMEALQANTDGIDNTGTGTAALIANTTGNDNTASGWLSLNFNTTGGFNTAMGSTSLATNTTGSYDTALGAYADVGSNNLSNASAIGARAQVTQSNSIVLGSIAGVNGATSNTNVGIGTTAPAVALDVHGKGNFTDLVTFSASQKFPGTGTITGVTAGTDLTGGGTSGNITLNVDTTKVVTGITPGTDLTGGGTGGVLTLNLDTTKVPQLAAANTFTGNQTVNGNLSATGLVSGSALNLGGILFAFGNYNLESAFLGYAGNTTTTGVGNTGTGVQALGSNTTGYVNTANGWGALHDNTGGSQNTASGYEALWHNTDGSNNTAYGSSALLANSTGNNNTASGMAALMSNTTGGYNTATGLGALETNSTGNYNTASGVSALQANTTASNNTAAGYQSLFTNTTGYGNTANGAGTLYANKNGYQNTADGMNALHSNTQGVGNTAVGYPALSANTTGSYNTGVGGGALSYNTTGMWNTASGASALSNNTSGSYNTAVGNGANVATATLTNATAIGAYAMVGRSNALVLGSINGVNGATASANVGIGTTTPQYTLDVQGTGRFTGNLTKGGGSFKIDHPLAPANKYLYHSFVESPDMMNIYNGNVVTDKRGLATIELPDWFEALNRDFRYQLTVIGRFAQAIVMEKVHNHQFTIKTNKPDVEVSWQVTGIRQDPYANAYRIPVEEVKPPQEQGRYLHPELFGAGPEKSVNARTAKPSVETPAQNASLSPARKGDAAALSVETIEATFSANGQGGSAVRTVKAEATTVRQ